MSGLGISVITEARVVIHMVHCWAILKTELKAEQKKNEDSIFKMKGIRTCGFCILSVTPWLSIHLVLSVDWKSCALSLLHASPLIGVDRYFY